MFLYLRWHGGTWQQNGRSLRSASRSLMPCPASLASSVASGGGVKLHCPCVMWYFSPFACL